jgi:hypothetical protein
MQQRRSGQEEDRKEAEEGEEAGRQNVKANQT